VVFSDPPLTIDIGRGGTTVVELGGRLWEAQVEGGDKAALRLSATTMSDDSKEALKGVLAARLQEALQREEEARALGADIERLMERAREVWAVFLCCMLFMRECVLFMCVCCVCVCVYVLCILCDV
jgi:hypothetical protein